MPFFRFKATNGRSVELQLKTILLRTPGKPQARDFTCHIAAHGKTAEVEIGASHTDASPIEVKKAVDDTLRALGFERVNYEHNGKQVKYDL